jgi:hypothetical protein
VAISSTSFAPGVVTNPNGRPVGSRNKRTQEVLNLLQARGDKDPLDALSNIITTNQDPAIVATAANILAPYCHSKRGTLPAPRFVDDPLQVPDFQTIDEAQDFQKEIARRAAAGELELQTSLDISTLIGNWIRSRQATIELDLKISAQGGPHDQTIRIEGGLPQLPGCDIIMPEINQGTNGHTIDHIPAPAIEATWICGGLFAGSMTSERDRRIISDYLIAAGEAVFHILGPGHVARAFITTAAKLSPDRVLTYPVEV